MIRLMMVILICGLWQPGAPIAWSAPDAEQAVQRELGKGDRAPWFDAETDRLQPIPMTDRDADAQNRSSNWEASWESQQRQNFNFTGEWIYTILQVLAWTALGILVIGTVFLLAWAFLRREAQQSITTLSSQSNVVDDRTRVENLPFQVAETKHDLLTEARLCFQRGDYGQAIIFLFSHQLVYLDRNHLIRLTKGKTNRQYLWDLRRQTGIASILEKSMIAFEDVFFGGHTISKDRCQGCLDQVEQLHRAVEQGGAS